MQNTHILLLLSVVRMPSYARAMSMRHLRQAVLEVDMSGCSDPPRHHEYITGHLGSLLRTRVSNEASEGLEIEERQSR